MTHSPLLSNASRQSWNRVSGHELQFFATDAEVQQWLLDGLPPEYAPYRLIGADLVQDGAVYVRRPFACSIESLVPCIGETRQRFLFSICSQQLSPGLHLQMGEDIDSICTLNGLIHLNHGGVSNGKQMWSRIAIVDRLRHEVTGEERRYEEYLKIFRSLRRVINKALVYSSIVTFKDGSEEEDKSTQRMTEGSVQAYAEGLRFHNRRPGKPIEKAVRAKK